jgi:hypothetical protein
MNEFQLTREKYVNSVKKYAFENGYLNLSDHITNICVSTMFDRDGILPGGGFVKSIVKNDLRGAIDMADNECYTHLKFIVRVFNFCYVENYYT